MSASPPGTRRRRPLSLQIGLRTRIIVGFILLGMTLIALISVVVLKVTERNLYSQKLRAGQQVIDSVNAVVPLVVPADDLPPGGIGGTPLPALVRQLGTRLGFSEYLLLDASSQVIAARDDAWVGRRIEDPLVRDALFRGRVSHQTLRAEGENLVTAIRFTGPVLVGGRAVAVLRFDLAMDDVLQMVTLTRSLIFFYLFLDTVVIVVLGSYVLLRVLVRPLQELLAAVRRVSAGSYDAPVPRGRTDEIGQLADAFAEMMASVRATREAQQRQMRSLQRVNEELKQAQREVLSSDRLAYVGRVAAGVAHEVGNPLAAIFGYLEILRDDPPEDPAEHRDYVRRIEQEVSRIDDIVRSLLDFARPSGAGMTSIQINDVVRDAAAIVAKQRVMDRTAVRLELAEALPPVVGDPKLLLQVLVNLLVNARDAMPEGGEIRIVTEAARFDRLAETTPHLPGLAPREDQSLHDTVSRHVRFSGRLPFRDGDGVVKITVADVGQGIDEGALERIFEPFFTTKAHGKGTGLGLAICQRIVDSFGGVLRAESKVGLGSRFTVYLPAAEAQDGSGG